MFLEYMFDFVIVRQSPHFSDHEFKKNSLVIVNGVEIRLGQLMLEPFRFLCLSHIQCDAPIYQKRTCGNWSV